MALPARVADVLADRVTMELERINRMYLHLYQPKLIWPGGVVGYSSTTATIPSPPRR